MNMIAKAAITHQDIYNFPFPHKLWIAIHSISCVFLQWNTDGTQIEVQLLALDNYLEQPKSIFKIKSRSSFLSHLRGYGFQLIKTESAERDVDEASVSGHPWISPNYSEIVMLFSHVHFLRYRIDLLANIRPSEPFSCPSNNLGEQKQTPFRSTNQLDGDLCYKVIGSGSALSKAHFKHQLILNFLSEVKTLEAKLKESEMRSKAKELEGKSDEDSMIELSAELFENPHDSVLYMGDEHRTAYAGFYGNCTDEQVLKFFGSYLPMYENDDNDEGEKRIANLNPSGKTQFQSNDGFEISFSLNEEAPIPPSPSGPLPNPVSSSLEPIFNTDDDDDKDEDLLMDEFLKFNEQHNKENQEPSSEPSQEPQIKAEQEKEENDTNFKNFFNQYRESLNLLYEKQ